ncbi:TetR/AcrR family transcriptional regulator [Methylotenera sp.]|uniref:TetR/AcrR family transcriptional regulator n=1 Tax=Methylotenera sp. TaxID=2051956 RepID=UPI00248947CF|nr:TetR/AcrR family transcriptional regulator [Methylotenera sp.]MDI1360531.1 TetR/AcrR family transcriptional regulator [Methylotenera sp.]
MTEQNVKQKIMAHGRTTVQAKGYSGLSFKELAKDVGVKSSSIHYYFPTKGDLGGALAAQYTSDFKDYLDGVLEEDLTPVECLQRYTNVFRDTLLNENRMCLGGIMSAEHQELPVEVRTEVIRFTEMNVDWIRQVLLLTLGKNATTTKALINQQALAIFAAVQGAQLVSRGRNDISIYDTAIETYRFVGLIP